MVFVNTKKHKLHSHLEMVLSHDERVQASSIPSNPCLVTKPYDHESKQVTSILVKLSEKRAY